MTVVWIFWVCSCSSFPFWVLNFLGFWIFLLFWVFIFILVFWFVLNGGKLRSVLFALMIFWVCSCSPSPSGFWILWGFEFSYFSGFLFLFQFFHFFHLVKIYTKHQTQKSNPDFWNMGLNLIFWVLSLLGLCFVDLVLARF